MSLPLDIAQEVIKQNNERDLEAWRQTRWQTAAIANMLGAKVKPEDLLKLPGEKSTRLDRELLKQLSRGERKT